MKKVVIPTLIALGVVVGIFMLRPGTEPKPAAPEPTAVQSPVPAGHLRDIARQLGVEVGPDQKADDLATDILVVLRDARTAGETALSEEAEGRALKLLTKDEQQTLRRALELARSASGRRVLVLGDLQESAK